jgi:CRP-like cAMP-binding protein
VADFGALAARDFDPAGVHPAVADFYARTAAFELDSWAEWCGAFRPFGRLLARLFSRRLQQLNVPLSGLDTSRGVTSEVLQLVDPATGAVRQADATVVP